MKEHLPFCREILHHFVAYGFVYSTLLEAHGRMGYDKIRKPMKNMMRIGLKKGFSWLGWDLIGMVKEAGKLEVWETVVSIFEITQN